MGTCFVLVFYTIHCILCTFLHKYIIEKKKYCGEINVFDIAVLKILTFCVLSHDNDI